MQIFTFAHCKENRTKGSNKQCSAKKQEQAVPMIYGRQTPAGNKHRALVPVTWGEVSLTSSDRVRWRAGLGKRGSLGSLPRSQSFQMAQTMTT